MTKKHHNEVTINFEETGKENIQLAVHKNIVFSDIFCNIQRMQIQNILLEEIYQLCFSRKDVIVILGTNCFILTPPLDYQRAQPGEPWLVRSSIGFTVSGPLPKKRVINNCLLEPMCRKQFERTDEVTVRQ